MTENSEAFEQLNARIVRLIKGAGATITWNENIPDPDSPQDLRQIDVGREQISSAIPSKAAK